MRRIIVTAAGLWALVSASVAGAAGRPADVPIKAFFEAAAMSRPALSPDGRHLAMAVPGPDGRTVLVVADATDPSRRKGIVRWTNGDIARVWWVNDRRLLFSLADYVEGFDDRARGCGAVDLDGADLVENLNCGWDSAYRFRRDGSDEILTMQRHTGGTAHDHGSATPFWFDTRTRKSRRATNRDEPRHAVEWAFDHQGAALGVRSIDRDGDAIVWARESANAPWREINRHNTLDEEHDFAPLAVMPDGHWLVTARRDDPARTAALYRFDPRTRTREAMPLVGLTGYDFRGRLILDSGSGQLVGASFVSDAAGMVWFDKRLQKIQAQLESMLPGMAVVFDCESCGTQTRFVVVAWSDRQPPVHFLFDSEREGSAALTLLGAARPGIDASTMAEQDFHRVPARDGESIPVYVTRPHGKGPWRTVVLVHGGPWLRGAEWGWSALPQFLASRGYLVLQPEFRGSTGFGHRWHRLGFKQWGRAMQDDLADAARWAVTEGLADVDRIAIAGGSYGGYAALMGVLNEPDVFRAAVNWVGVTDPALMYTYSASDLMGSSWLRDAFPRMVGDVDKDAEYFRQGSPLRRAAEIKRPVLMAYGALDRRVPLVHGTRMRDALKEAGRSELVWIEYEDEAHGFAREDNRIDFWRRVEAFLARHLK